MHQHSHYRGCRRRKEEGPEKIFEEIIAKDFPNMGKETNNHSSPGSTKNPIQGKPEEDRAKTHINQINKN